MADNIQGSAKTGLGAALVVDGQQFPAAWLPSSVDFTRNTLDVTHAQTKNFRASIPEELTEPLEANGQFYFDMSLTELVELMTDEGAGKERQIYIMIPKTAEPAGVTHEHGYIYLPKGRLGIGTINLDIGDTMKSDFVVTGGVASPEIAIQKEVSGNVPTGTTFSTTNLSGTASGDVVATLDYPSGLSHGPAIFFNLAGADASEFTLRGRYIVANDSVTTGAKSLTVDVAGYTAWEEGDTARHLTGEAVGFTLS